MSNLFLTNMNVQFNVSGLTGWFRAPYMWLDRHVDSLFAVETKVGLFLEPKDDCLANLAFEEVDMKAVISSSGPFYLKEEHKKKFFLAFLEKRLKLQHRLMLAAFLLLTRLSNAPLCDRTCSSSTACHELHMRRLVHGGIVREDYATLAAELLMVYYAMRAAFTPNVFKEVDSFCFPTRRSGVAGRSMACRRSVHH